MARKFLIRTFGCQMNEHDSERLAGLLIADGLEATDVLDDADVVVLNTCCIRENADNKLYGHLGHLRSLKAERPELQIAVTGCLSQKEKGALRERADHIDVVVGTHNITRTPLLLRQAALDGPITEILDAPDPVEMIDAAPALTAVREVPWAAWVTIQTGCDNSCAYCIVPSVRGREISRPLDDIVAEATMLASRGVVELTLLGQNVNSYGRDITKRRPLFSDLLEAVGAVEGLDRVRFTSPHPKDLRPETIAAMAKTAAVCNQLHLPLQSGSNTVLSAMRRGYTAERYLDRLAAAREQIDDLAVTTDIIVGFPGETEEDFEQTLTVAAQAQFDSAYTFIFSPRAGTRAAENPAAFIDPDVVADRFERLHLVVERSALAKHEARVGVHEELLVEGPSKRDATVTSGRTRQGKLVHFRTHEPTAMRPGAVVEATITRGAPHFLEGTFRRVLSPSRTVRRLELRSA